MVNEYLGGAAGAALGFIHNDVRGAVTGWSLGREAARSRNRSRVGVSQTKKMDTPTPSSSRDFNMFTAGARSQSRGRSTTRKGSTKRSRSSRSTVSTRSRSTVRARRVKGKTPKAENINTGNATKKRDVKKNKRAVKVSPIFRKKVKQALESKALKGVHTNRGYNRTEIPNSNQQNLVYFSWNGATDRGVYFTPTAVSDAAAQLWKGKTPNVDTFANLTANFNMNNAVIKVVNSYVTAEFVNMSHRTHWITIYECMYKSNRAFAEVPDAVGYWQKCIDDDIASGIAKPGANGYDAVVASTYTKLGATPGQTSNFHKVFKYTSRNIVLEPGQRFVHHIQGPKNTVYDYSKFFVNNVYTNGAANRSISCFAVMHSDIVNPDAGFGAGRYRVPSGTGAEVGGHYVSVETKCTFVLELPEQAGFTYPSSTTSGTVQDLNTHKRAWLDNVWIFGPDPNVTAMQRTDANQPATDT